ncbi:MAG: ribosome maturation factor RimM, partial [Calditrichia bacterium]
HGTEGWLKVRFYSRRSDRLDGVKIVYFESAGGVEGKILEAVEGGQRDTLLKLKDVDNREQAKQWNGKEVLLPENSRISLEEDTFFIDDLLECEVINPAGQPVGIVKDVLEGNGSDIYVIQTPEREILVPAIGEFVKKVDVQNRKIVVELWEEL